MLLMVCGFYNHARALDSGELLVSLEGNTAKTNRTKYYTYGDYVWDDCPLTGLNFLDH